ncbi:amino acid ABC transporter ATP-binding protein [Bartonella krasnovii]|uniref:Amino acid ABC transporter ATP-binding protein n=1 Tax=Bartonella krasnovii TaxID=2267275 RepID=A0ABY3VX95_9HYPH|nr:amino acid ABC transporter ATP-binding protein [Bartonella krasnovii]UNF36338.1 amino acid ABC transporter ATP-binding protein [Bartonella krasnovii]UNF38014.1 amino acid ABC transporter ATP-binding protein [Bartonella krasnovii]UNF39742.1 amino acid ABC transporter ATP-binding protein [Bartonella krasnovii]UNF41419.1 amino acid ABC transporter ATP-binding protein [Bartonella krasnovii]
MISIRNLNKWYGNFHVLQDINFDVQAGEHIVICGPSGSGKSTLIRCINQLEQAQKGSICIHNVDINTAPIQQQKNVLRKIGMVFQNFNLFPHMSVIQNCILAPMTVQGLSKQQAKERAIRYLTHVGIEKHCEKYPLQLSGGQQQRVAIARALCMEPEVMLFDEPTSALDPESVGEVLEVIAQLADTGITMLCVTHEMSFAKKVSERILFLENGKIVEDTASDKFFTNPKSQRACDFLAKIKH